MKIEEEIKQTEFRNEFHKASLNLIFTASRITGRSNNFFKNHGISVSQYNVLRILKGQHPKAISTSDIKQRMLDKSSDVSRIVDRLFRKKLVAKNSCPTDKRLVDINITDQGLNLLSKLKDDVDHITENLGSLNDSEAKLLNQLLDKAREK